MAKRPGTQAELDAVNAIVQALLPLSQRARERIMRYAMNRATDCDAEAEPTTQTPEGR